MTNNEVDFEFKTYTDTDETGRNSTQITYEVLSNHWDKQTRIKWTFALFLGCLLAYSSRTTLSICAVSIGKEFGWDKKLSGIVLSAFFFGYILTQVIGGVLADYLGGERMLYLSGGVWSLSIFLTPIMIQMSILPVTAVIIVMQVLSGAAQGFHFPAIASLLSKRVAIENRNSVFSFAASGTVLGTICSGFAGSLLLDYSGWRSVFLFTGGASILWVLVISIFVSRDPSVTEQKLASFDKVEVFQWKKLIKTNAFWALMVCATCESLVFTNLLSWLPTYFREEFPKGQGWLFNVCPWIASFIIQNLCGIISDKMILSGVSRTKVRKLFVALALFTVAVLSIVLSHVTSFQSSLILMTLIIGFLGCNSSGIGMNPQDLAPKHAGSVFGIMNTLGAVSGTLGVYITGNLLHHSNNWSSIFYMTSMASFVGGLSFILFGTGKKIL